MNENFQIGDYVVITYHGITGTGRITGNGFTSPSWLIKFDESYSKFAEGVYKATMLNSSTGGQKIRSKHSFHKDYLSLDKEHNFNQLIIRMKEIYEGAS